MKGLTGFNSVSFCRDVDGIIMAEAVRQEGVTKEGLDMYMDAHLVLNCIFTERRGKTNWTKQLRMGRIEFENLMKNNSWGRAGL